MRLFVGRFLDLNVGGGLVDLPLKLVTSLLEFSEALAKPTGELGELLGAEKENHDENDKNRFRPAGHAKGNRECHTI